MEFEKNNKYLWLTDTHLNFLNPGRFFSFISKIRKENPEGVFLTGDISEGNVAFWLKQSAKRIKCPIYFILGNHDLHGSSFKETHFNIKENCQKYSNLIWLEEQNDPIKLDEEVALIGADGWYSANNGNPEYLNYTLDWILIKELRELSNLKLRIERYKELADKSAFLIKERLEMALEQDYKTIYILTHMPPFKEVTRDEGTFSEPFWLPYNVNLQLGNVIKDIMKNRKTRNVIICCGHSHQPEFIRITRNISCQVGRPCNKFSINSQTIYI